MTTVILAIAAALAGLATGAYLVARKFDPSRHGGW